MKSKETKETCDKVGNLSVEGQVRLVKLKQ